MSIDQQEAQASGAIELEEMNPNPDVLPSVIDERENIPSTMFYRSFAAKRPNPQDLRAGNELGDEGDVQISPKKQGGQYGTFSGVYLRVTMNILSVVFYLRTGWAVGNCGLLMSLLLILICGITTTLTALSLSAIVTNGTVKGGGVYYFISRSLGPNFGGTIGVVFSFATTFGAVLQTYGFVEVVRDLIGKNITKDGDFDIPIIGISLITVLVITVSISLSWEFYLQYVLSTCIIISIVGFLFGPCFSHTPSLTISNLRDNLYPHYQEGNDFWTIFGVFFPAFVGIMAGANISGDLKDPQKSIPIGTLGGIWTTTLLYMIVAVMLAAAGDWNTLVTDPTLMARCSVWRYLVTIGCIAASVSSASAAVVGGPKTFQALCKDELLPSFFKFFSVGKKGSGDPIRGFVLAWVIVTVSTFIFKDLNAVGKALTNFFLVSYALICLSAMVGKMSKSPGWRPAWKYYHWTTCLLGAGLCIAGMFLTSWVFAICVIAISILLFMYFHWSERSSNWGEFPQSLQMTNTIMALQKIADTPTHVKNYRPQFEYIINYDFGEIDSQQRNFIPFKQISTTSSGLLVVSSVGKEAPEVIGGVDCSFTRRWGNLPLDVISRLVSQAGGISKVRPNVLATSFVKNADLFNMIGSAFDNKLGVAISRNFEAFDPALKHTWPIDVWWLSDDGGLVILLGYLLSQHEQWKDCKLRCFTATAKGELNDVQIKMQRLLSLFRIDAEVIVVSGLENEPSNDTKQHWDDMNVPVDEQTLKKVNVFLRLRELMIENSGASSLVLCSMPIPRATAVPDAWIALLDIVSDAMPPFVWVHGNNENVVTFIA